MASTQQLDADRYRYLFFISTLTHWAGSFWRMFQWEGGPNVLMDHLRQAKQIAESPLVEMLSVRMTSNAIARKYFDGRALYFTQQELFLDRLIAHTEQIIEDLNEVMSLLQKLNPDSKGWHALHIDLEALHAMVDPNIPIRLERIEQDARIALLE